MPFKIDDLNLFPIEYENAVKDLLECLNEAEDIYIKNNLLEEFTEKYTTVPQIWRYWFSLNQNGNRSGEDEKLKFNCKTIFEKAIKDFSGHEQKEWPCFNEYRNSNLPLEQRIEYSKTFAFLPHSNISLAFEIHKEYLDHPLSQKEKKRYEKALKISQKLSKIDAVVDGKNYIEILKEMENEEFLMKNVECKLASYPWNRDFWKIYIGYLENEKHDNQELLKVLKRFCRLFLNDTEMKKKYRRKIEENTEILPEIHEYWIDLILFAFQFESQQFATELFEKALNSKICNTAAFLCDAMEIAKKLGFESMQEKISEKKMAYLLANPQNNYYNLERVVKNSNFANVQQPIFPFPKPINRYVDDQLDHQHLRKLYQTCKYFYSKHRLNLVHRCHTTFKSISKYNEVIHVPFIEFKNHSVYVDPFFNYKKFQNIWYTHTLYIDANYQQLLQKAQKITLKYLSICISFLTEKEFQQLTESKTIEKLHIQGTQIVTETNEIYGLAKILEAVPKIKYYREFHCRIEDEEKLLALKLENKISVLSICFDHHDEINLEIFYQFLVNNLAPSAIFYISNTPNQQIREFLKEKLETWHPENEKPILNSTYINWFR